MQAIRVQQHKLNAKPWMDRAQTAIICGGAALRGAGATLFRGSFLKEKTPGGSSCDKSLCASHSLDAPRASVTRGVETPELGSFFFFAPVPPEMRRNTTVNLTVVIAAKNKCSSRHAKTSMGIGRQNKNLLKIGGTSGEGSTVSRDPNLPRSRGREVFGWWESQELASDNRHAMRLCLGCYAGFNKDARSVGGLASWSTVPCCQKKG